MRVQSLAAFVLAWALLPAVQAQDLVTKPEAEAMVGKALKYLKGNGKDKLYAEVSKKDGQFTDRDLYLVVYGLDGTVRAHGANGKMIGKNLMEIKDVDGKYFIKERVELAKKNKPFSCSLNKK